MKLLSIILATFILSACAQTIESSEPDVVSTYDTSNPSPECSEDFRNCATYHVVTCARQECSCTWWIPKGTDQQWSLIPETMTCGLTGWDQAPDAQ